MFKSTIGKIDILFTFHLEAHFYEFRYYELVYHHSKFMLYVMDSHQSFLHVKCGEDSSLFLRVNDEMIEKVKGIK